MGRSVCDLTNKKFGKLTVISRDLSKPTGAGKSAYWICQCDCGNICSIRSDKLKNGITQSLDFDKIDIQYLNKKYQEVKNI